MEANTLTFDELEDICRTLQKKSDFELPNNGYYLIHCDGRSFSKVIKNRFEKPFDRDFAEIMNQTAIYAAKKIQGCAFAYVQSDEITFVVAHNLSRVSAPFFRGRLCKIQSIVASMCSSFFNFAYMKFWNEHVTELGEFGPDKLIQFDCKCWHVETYTDVIQWLTYRQMDCIRNSKLMLAQNYFSHKQLMNKTPEDAVQILEAEKQINWSYDVEPGFKIGRSIYRRLKEFYTEDTHTLYHRHVWEVHPDICFFNQKTLDRITEEQIIPQYCVLS